MDDLAALLYRGESESLDFKRDQYQFANAPDHEKAKLLKDILAMANSWRSETAYILIGVDEKPGPMPTVVGIQDHLDDADLQQFVNSKTQRPIHFNYSVQTLAAKALGVLSIPVQKRPFHLVKDYTDLKANTVYLRRGSSTDQASLDEIARMGEESKKEHLDLQVQFADFEQRTPLGGSTRISCVDYIMPEGLPPFQLSQGFQNLTRFANREYYRECAQYFWEEKFFNPLAVTVTNRSSILASRVRVELEL